MKTKVLNLLETTKNVLFIAFVSGVILEIIILLFFEKFVERFPYFLDTYNYILAVLALPFLLMLILLPERENSSMNDFTEKETKREF